MASPSCLAVTVLSSKPDRWGRLPAFASTSTGQAGGLAAEALASGLARYRPEPAAAACRAALLAAEDGARRAKIGLWADAFYDVLAPGNQASFAAHAGTDVIVEGRLRAVEPGLYRKRLRFENTSEVPSGSHHRQIEATIVPRTLKTFAARGVILQALIGQTLRVRGLLDRRFGPRIELAGPDDIELVSATSTPRRAN